MSEPRTCGCDCGQPLDGRRENARYVNDRHRQRAYRNRLKSEAEAKGLSSNLSLRTVRATRATPERNGDGRRRAGRAKRPSDIRSSYDRNIQAVTRVLTGPPLHIAPGLAARLATRAARDALSERQRAAVEKRETTGRGDTAP